MTKYGVKLGVLIAEAPEWAAVWTICAIKVAGREVVLGGEGIGEEKGKTQEGERRKG